MNIMKVSVFCLVILFIFVLCVFALKQKEKLKPATVFGDYMVLQRDMPLEIFGQAARGETVTVEFAGQKVSATAGKDGSWLAELQPLKAGGPYEMTITARDETIIYKDVLMGDVWFCSGQSNMEWQLMHTIDGEQELKNFSVNPNIRLFLQEQIALAKPASDAAGAWTACDAENAGNFSAIAYFFGSKLQKDMNVPIGLIDSSWGGTPIEIWMDENLLKGNPVTQPIIDRWKASPVFDWKNWNYGKGMNYKIEISDIRFFSSTGKAEPAYIKMDQAGQGTFGGVWTTWAKPGSTLEYKSFGKAGSASGIMGFNAWAGAGTVLNNGQDVDLSVYDKIIFKVRGTGKFSISLDQNSITDYDNYASPDYDAEKEWKDISIPLTALKQGGWGIAKPFTQNAIKMFQLNVKSATVELPSALYNGMVAPFTKCRIRGVIWYQGETNADRAAQYGTLLPATIKSWRKAWAEGDFPFIIAQLPNYMARKAEPGDSAWAELREAQIKALGLSNTAVVSTIDLGDPNDIHPRIKRPAADRLATAAMVIAYGKDGPATGPVFDSMSIDKNKIIIKFRNIGKGLESRNGDLKGFSMAGDDRQFKWAKAEIKDDTVIVWNDEIKEPKAIRYAWADNPDCNLYNKEGLAASPFRTDDWPGVTENNR